MRRRAHLAVLWGGLSCVGCFPRGSATPDTDTPIPPEDNPVLTSRSQVCLPEQGVWEVDAETQNPAGGLVSWWTVDGVVVEQHRFGVVESAEDGSWDRLRGVLNIVADWREQAPNVSTRFTCGDPVNTLYWIENPVGARIQCEVGGPNPEVFADLEGVPECP